MEAILWRGKGGDVVLNSDGEFAVRGDQGKVLRELLVYALAREKPKAIDPPAVEERPQPVRVPLKMPIVTPRQRGKPARLKRPTVEHYAETLPGKGPEGEFTVVQVMNALRKNGISEGKSHSQLYQSVWSHLMGSPKIVSVDSGLFKLKGGAA